MNQKTEHCCQWMDLFINDPRVTIIYLPYYRVYGIPYLQKSEFICSSTEIRKITYCPWCSKRLPESLYNEWFEILEKEYGLDDPHSKEQQLLTPQQFKTDEWWKKRGL